MMDKTLFDTDVILDVFFDRKPSSDNASKILSLCEKENLKGFITPVFISSVYYLLRKTANHKKVIKSLKELLSTVDIAIINKAVILEALNSDFKDFEDALQSFSKKTKRKLK